MIRLLDIIFSIFGIIIFAPIFIIISILVKISSRGPVFYMQKRVGKNNIDFRLFKFRTMFQNADKLSLITIGNRDNRITRIGSFLRRYKLDELPQLLNVVLGQMSLVGPRPEVRKYVNYYSPIQMEVLSVKPGITDWASIIYRDENQILGDSAEPEKEYLNIILPMKIKYNQIFIRKYGCFEYLKILIATVIKILYPKYQFSSTQFII